MLFKKEWVNAVLNGRKSQSIRVKKPRVKIGRSYAVQTSYYSKSLGRIQIIDVRPCTLGSLTDEDIHAEGWHPKSRRKFEMYFAEINHMKPETMTKKDWNSLRNQTLWCITFKPEDPISTPKL